MPTPDPRRYGRTEIVPMQMLPEVVFDCLNPDDEAPSPALPVGRPKRRKARWKHLLALVAALAGGIGLYWLLSDRLTKEEQQLVGVWSRKVTLKSPDDTLVVWEMNDDRSVRIAIFDTSTGQPLQQAIEGHWSAYSGELVIDYELRTLHRLSRSVSALRPHLQPLNAESLTIESVESTSLRLKPRRLPPVPQPDIYTRMTDAIAMPASFTPKDLAKSLGR